VSDGEAAFDVTVTAADDDAVGTLLPVLGEALGRPVGGLWAGSARLPDDLPLTAGELAHGAALGLGRPVPQAEPAPGCSALELHVVGGPDSGRTLPLGRGRHVIGRSEAAAVRLDDPDVSRQHVAVHVGGGTITVADLGSTNGSTIDDDDVAGDPRPWPPSTVLRLGTSALTVAAPVGGPTLLHTAPGGRRELRLAPRMTTPSPDVEVEFPRPPSPPPRRRLAWVAVALPAVGGVAMAWLLHTPTFLFFALLSPVVALGTWASERWSGRRSGRRKAAAHAVEVHAAQTRLADAVRADVRASEAAHPDLAALATAARRRSSLVWSRARGDAHALTVRIGSGPGPTRVVRVEPEGGRVREVAPHVPVVVDLRADGGLAVVGPRRRTIGSVAAVVAQLATLHAAGEVELLLLTDADRLADWRWTRWLPHLPAGAVHVRSAEPTDPADAQEDCLHVWFSALAARRRAARTSRSGQAEPSLAPSWLVVLADRPLDGRTAATLRAARDVGIVTVAVADTPGDVPVGIDAVLRLRGETGDVGVLCRQGAPDRAAVHVDRLPEEVAAALARHLAPLVPAHSASALPRHVRLLELPATGLRLGDQERVTGLWSPARDRLVTTLGATAHGPLTVDLCRQGPHALVAGTTGSGKSELLQTLIAGLALNHPPDRCSFLLVDYKGGAAFAEAASLPHTVGLVTDLDGQTTARALRSLSAELARREAILAAHEVPDIAALPEDVDLARLVIVVDEFAGLAEELPGFVPGLVAIAQRGRSLGVHLVLATQRPSGVVSPEIRANCSLRICLRTTDEADSRDVLGTADAAHLPVDVPGRAYVWSGSGAPTALQVARVATTEPVRSGTGPAARLSTWPVVTVPPAPAGAAEGASDLARLCRAVQRHAAGSGVPAPHRPWRPPLPDRIVSSASEEDDVHDGGPDGTLLLGLIDRPDRQAQERLGLDLTAGGTWLAVGGPRSGRTTFLRTVLGEAVHRFGPDRLHVHVLESGGGALASEAASLPHTGTVVTGEDALRTVRLVDRLARSVAARRDGRAGQEGPLILLLVDGMESISALLDEHDPGQGSAGLLRLMRDGAAVGLTCVVTADRAVPGGRLAAVARQRLVLPLPDRADYAVAGIPARAVPGHRPPGRALVGELALECQLALPRRLVPAPRSDSSAPAPLRIVELPPDPGMTVRAMPGDPRPVDAACGTLPLPIGPGGDEGRPLVVDLLRTGGLLVSGPPGSGRSSALTAFSHHLESVGAAVLHVGRPYPGSAGPGGGTWVEPTDAETIATWTRSLDGRVGVVIADDVGAPAEFPGLSALPALGARAGLALIAAAATGQLSGHFQGPIAALRRHRAGLLLCPGHGDADLLGIRLPRTPVPVRPGSGWLVTGSAVERVQVARRRISAAVIPPQAGQSSSSAGPISWRAYQASS
jgi:S-DNA-T family DNA segregation ATPase FtsK/SpoIIIE